MYYISNKLVQKAKSLTKWSYLVQGKENISAADFGCIQQSEVVPLAFFCAKCVYIHLILLVLHSRASKPASKPVSGQHAGMLTLKSSGSAYRSLWRKLPVALPAGELMLFGL